MQAAMGTHIEPLRASPTTEMPEPTNASITIVEHKQSSALPHEAADRSSPPNQVVGPDTVCDTIGAHTKPPKASPIIMEPDATTEPTNPTINRAESTLGSNTTTSVQ